MYGANSLNALSLTLAVLGTEGDTNNNRCGYVPVAQEGAALAPAKARGLRYNFCERLRGGSSQHKYVRRE